MDAYAISSTAITVQWEALPCIEQNGDITDYTVTVLGGGEIERVKDVDGNVNEVIIPELTPSTTYSIQVAAVNSQGTGPYSDIVIINTPDSELNTIFYCSHTLNCINIVQMQLPEHFLCLFFIYYFFKKIYSFLTLFHLYFDSDVYLSLNDVVIPNNGYVIISDIGTTGVTGLLCHTNHPADIPGGADGMHSGGAWFTPDVTEVLHNSNIGFRRIFGSMVIKMYRHTPSASQRVEGIYNCQVQDATDTLQTVYVGLYE